MLHESGDGGCFPALPPSLVVLRTYVDFVLSRILRDGCFTPADIAAALRERFARFSMFNACLSARHGVRWSLAGSSSAVSIFSFLLCQPIPFWTREKGIVVVIVH